VAARLDLKADVVAFVFLQFVVFLFSFFSFYKEFPMKILVINNSGGGFADHMDVESGTSVAQLFSKVVPQGRAEDYLIRVNRLPAAREQILQEGERVSFTPVKIEGARCGRMAA
jgi:hypothetical protein